MIETYYIVQKKKKGSWIDVSFSMHSLNMAKQRYSNKSISNPGSKFRIMSANITKEVIQQTD